MAKIIVTACPGPMQKPIRRIIDTDNCMFQESGSRGTEVNLKHGGFIIKESIEEVYKLINEAETATTHAKLDLILVNQEEILKLLRER